MIVYSATGGGRQMGGGGGGARGGTRGGGGLHSSARVTCAMLHIVIIWGLSILLSLPLIFAMELGWTIQSQGRPQKWAEIMPSRCQTGKGRCNLLQSTI